MQYNNRAILAMIASALNSKDPDAKAHIYFKDGLAELELTPDRNALMAYMVDGRQFRITVEEAV